mgnify:CR=1 FL=1
MTTLADLLKPKTAAEWRATLLGLLSGSGFPVTSWGSGGVARTLVEVYCAALADVQSAVTAIARAGILETLEGAWLTIVAHNFYNTDRILPGFTEGLVTVTAAAGAGPYTIDAGAFIVGIQGAEDSDARRYIATESKTLNPGQTLLLAVKAESPGTRFNVSSNTINFAFTPFPGVTVSNPPVGETWVTRPGLDEESDARLRQRCVDRWATLGTSWADATVRYWTLSSTNEDGTPTGVTRMGIVYGGGFGDYTVVVASDAGGVSSGVVTAVQAFLDARKPLTDDPTVVSATETVVAVQGTVRVRFGQNTLANRTKVADALVALQASLGIGDLVDLGALYAAIRGAIPGIVVDVDITTPIGDTVIGVTAVAVLDVSHITNAANWSEV